MGRITPARFPGRAWPEPRDRPGAAPLPDHHVHHRLRAERPPSPLRRDRHDRLRDGRDAVPRGCPSPSARRSARITRLRRGQHQRGLCDADGRVQAPAERPGPVARHLGSGGHRQPRRLERPVLHHVEELRAPRWSGVLPRVPLRRWLDPPDRPGAASVACAPRLDGRAGRAPGSRPGRVHPSDGEPRQDRPAHPALLREVEQGGRGARGAGARDRRGPGARAVRSSRQRAYAGTRHLRGTRAAARSASFGGLRLLRVRRSANGTHQARARDRRARR